MFNTCFTPYLSRFNAVRFHQNIYMWDCCKWWWFEEFLFVSCWWHVTYLYLKSVEKWHILKDFDPFPVQFLTHTPAVPLITKMVSDLGECLWQSQKRCFKTVLVRVATKHIKRLRKLNESQWDTMRLCQTQWHSAKLSKTQYNLTMLSKIQQDLADSVTLSKTE